MVEWNLVYTKKALKDARKCSSSGLKFNATKILDILKKDLSKMYCFIVTP